MDLSRFNPWLRRRGVLLVPAPPDDIDMQYALELLLEHRCKDVDCNGNCAHRAQAGRVGIWLCDVTTADIAGRKTGRSRQRK